MSYKKYRLPAIGYGNNSIVPYSANDLAAVSDILFTPRSRSKQPGKRPGKSSSKSSGGPKRSTSAKQINRAGDTQTTTVNKKRKRAMKMSTGIMVKKLSKELKKLKPSLATYRYLVDATFQPSAAINLAGYASYDICSPAFIEQALTTLPLIDEAAPGTTTSTDMRSVVQNTKYYYQVRCSSIMRNNYLFPVEVRWYHLRPKQGTSTSPTDLMASADNKATLPVDDYQHICFYPSDWDLFNHSWKIVHSGKQVLNSGEELRLHHTKEGSYDQEVLDEFTHTYDRKSSELVLIRVQGTVCHDSTTNSIVGISNVKLDGIVKRSIKIRYPNTAPTRIMNYATGLGAVAAAEMVVDTAEKENTII